MTRAEGINWNVILAVAAGAGALYLLSKLSSAGQVATNAVSSAAADVYNALTLGPPMQVTGSVDDLQGNLLGPIASFPSSHDNQGNTYLAINGAWYQLGPRDASGNFTAIPTGASAVQ
jgi:hypothetical protein